MLCLPTLQTFCNMPLNKSIREVLSSIIAQPMGNYKKAFIYESCHVMIEITSLHINLCVVFDDNIR